MTRATPSTDPGTAPLICVIDDDSSVREALSSLFRSIGLRSSSTDPRAEFFESAAAGGGRLPGARYPDAGR